MDLEKIVFGNQDSANVLARMRPDQIDALTFGAVELSADGTIVYFSQRESELTGRSAAEVVGKNFFKEIAPCTRRPEFQGAFQEGVKSGQLNTVFEYVFDYRMNPTRVKVHMIRSVRKDDSYWIFVNRL